MKVIGFSGSPRKGGNTDVLVNQVLAGAAEHGAVTKFFRVADAKISPCMACMHCRTKDGCALNDDMQGMYQEIKEADAIVFGTPVYMYQETAQMKTFIDRFFPFLNTDYTSKIRKRGVMVFSQGNPDLAAFRPNIDSISSALGLLGVQIENITGAGGHLEKGGVKTDTEVMETARKAGAGLAAAR